MYATDPIDSLLAIYENPLPKNQARADFEEDIMALDYHLKSLIDTHSGSVTDRNQSKLAIQCMGLRNQIGQYFELVNPQQARGN
jgi:hypothetical protein